MKSPPNLILASTSLYRRELLNRLRVPFTCESPGIEETPLTHESAGCLTTRLAKAKASAVAARHPEAWVVGSDQVALRIDPAGGEVILGKPGTVSACIEQLRGCSSTQVSFITAVAVTHHGEGSILEFTDITRVRFRSLDDTTIARYVERESPLDCAGGFKSEGLGITLCESIDSVDPTALIGLPLIRLSALLREIGFELP